MKLKSCSRRQQRRCAALLRDGAAILSARRGFIAHTHVLWLSLGALAYLLAATPQLGWLTATTSLVLFFGLGAIALFDIRYFVIPDGPALALGAAGVLSEAALDAGQVPSRLLAAAGAFVACRAFALIYLRLRGFEGLGQGDARLFALAGLWLGAPALPGFLLVAAISGLFSALLLRADGAETAKTPLPFGPHLALALWLGWAVGPLELG